MSGNARKKLNNVNKIFQNPKQNEIHSRIKSSEMPDGLGGGVGSEIKLDGTQPIYFDELSLSKFIEDYLDYQITYAYD